MEENEGKNLAAEKRIKAQFDANVINLVHRFKEGNMSSFEIGNVQVDIKKADKMYTISFGGYDLCSVDENDNITYNISELEKFKEKAEELMENGMPDLTEELGLPDIEYLKYLEKEKNRNLEEGKEKEKGEEERENKEEPEDKEQDDEEKDDIEEEEKPKTKGGLLELNLGVLVLINPKLRECTKAYLDPNTNELVFKDRFGKEKGPGEYGFRELKAEDTNFELTKMHEDGKVTRNENPTRLYIIPDQTHGFGISVDFATHHREVNLVVKDNHEGHEDSFSIINGNLAKFDSGDIPTTKTSYDIGIREGIFKSGDRNETNEKAKEILDKANDQTRENLQKGFAEQGNKINDDGDLKNAIANVLEKEPYNEEPEEAMEIATEIVDKGRRYEDIKAEREEQNNSKKNTDTNDDNEEFDPRDPRAGDPRWQ